MADSRLTAATKKAKEDAFSVIDAAITMCDKLSDIEMANNSLANYGLGPFNFLINIGISLGIYNEMLEWLEKFIIYFMPILEWSAKGIILSNLQAKISCNEDPRIPKDFRLNQPNLYEKNLSENTKKGFLVDIQGIDYTNLLSISPLSKEGKNLYFGNENGCAEEFVRASDMNAFLWYVIHLGIHQQPIEITSNNSISEFFANNYKNSSVMPNSASCLSSFEVTGSTMNGIMAGTTFIRKNGNTILGSIKNDIATDYKYNTQTNITDVTMSWKADIAPISYSYDTTNWYYDSSAIKVSLVEAKNVKEYEAKEKTIKRKYNKEFPILQLRYYNGDIKSLKVNKVLGKTTYNNLQNKLQVAVLPKPFQIFPPSFTLPNDLKDIFARNLFKLKYVLFNEQGKQDKKGHYSCLIEPLDANNMPNFNTNKGLMIFKLSNVKFAKIGYLVVDYKQWKYVLSYDESGNNIITSEDELSQILYECYPKLTVYELMGDLVFGTRLLDSKTICSQLIDSVINLRLGGTFTISQPRAKYIEKVNNIVKNIVEADGSVIDDCFFNFSNDRFSEMIEKSNELRKNNYTFIGDTVSSVTTSTSGVQDILSEYSEGATKEENKAVIHRAFISAINTISDNVTSGQSLSIKCDIITQLLQNLMSSIVINLISPKIALLFEMEKQMMGDNSQSLSFESFMTSIYGIIIGIIKEIADILIEEFKKVIFAKLKEIAACMALKIAKEKIENYTAIIKEIIANCSFGLGGSQPLLDTDITNVDYADITNTPIKNKEC